MLFGSDEEVKREERAFNRKLIAFRALLRRIESDVNGTLKALGGVLERTEVDPEDNILTNVYWFDVDNCLEKYKDTYEPFISKDNFRK